MHKEVRNSLISPKITFALAGDALLTRKISVFKDQQFLSMIDLIRKADASFVNCEMLFFDYNTAYPAANSGGTWVHSNPQLAEELRWAGFDFCSLANNHSLDYGIEGLISTMNSLKNIDMPFSGVGLNLAEAQAPVYIESDSGRIALISLCSTFSKGDEAAPQRKDLNGRPGLNPVKYDVTYFISENSEKAILQIGKEAGLAVKKKGKVINFMDKFFETSVKTGSKTKLNLNCKSSLIEVVKEAKRNSDWVIVNSHTHEGEKESPPDFLIELARVAIDNGADIVISQGYHGNRPIEIYKGCPIFYGLGNFIFQNETVEKLPADMYVQFKVSQEQWPGYLQDERIKAMGKESFVVEKDYWESFIAFPTFLNTTDIQKRKLIGLELYPITLGYGHPRAQRGRPRLADKKQGKLMINKIRKMSIPFGTEITYNPNKNIGEVVLNNE